MVKMFTAFPRVPILHHYMHQNRPGLLAAYISEANGATCSDHRFKLTTLAVGYNCAGRLCLPSWDMHLAKRTPGPLVSPGLEPVQML